EQVPNTHARSPAQSPSSQAEPAESGAEQVPRAQTRPDWHSPSLQAWPADSGGAHFFDTQVRSLAHCQPSRQFSPAWRGAPQVGMKVSVWQVRPLLQLYGTQQASPGPCERMTRSGKTSAMQVVMAPAASLLPSPSSEVVRSSQLAARICSASCSCTSSQLSPITDSCPVQSA